MNWNAGRRRGLEMSSRVDWRFLQGPALFGLFCLALLGTGLLGSPQWVMGFFDNEGRAPVEVVTIWLFWFSIASLWLRWPRTKGEWWQRVLLSLIIVMAIIKETDAHLAWVQPSGLPGATHGTPFKMKFLTNDVNPLKDRLVVLGCFTFFFAVCGGTLLWYLRRLLTGVWRREAVSWTVGTIGGTGILIQIFDRTPSVLRKDFGVVMGEQTRALFAAFEEGLELLLPLLIVLAVYQAAKADRAQEAAWPKA